MEGQADLGIIFLNYDPEGKNKELADKARQSIFDNTRGIDYDFYEIANVVGFVNAVNKGLSIGLDNGYKFLIFVANDVEIKDPDFVNKLMCEEGISGWRRVPFFITGNVFPDFALWGISMKTVEKVGFMDTRFAEGYGFDDNDLCFRVEEAGMPLIDAHVDLVHHENKTYQAYFRPVKEAMTIKNETYFREKWRDKLKPYVKT